ncbi:MAG: 16S rRNA (guanine(527)-N(7))-methyltransferase RsmG [bacterium]|nr:16S rRNA (guanine(527)-N(7))-methyltransferase RsmG [bacterium]
MKNIIVNLCENCKSLGIALDSNAAERLEIYANLLIEWNQKMNLTAITEPEEIAQKHFFDCLLFIKHIEIKKNAKIIDVGTGAGFPGVVLKIARPDIELTLLDSLNKRLVFLDEVLHHTGLSAQTLHSRAEDGARTALRESFDISTARAVASLNTLCEYCLPYVKPGGIFVSMKGPNPSREIEESLTCVKLLGAKIERVEECRLATGEERSFVVIKKISQTSSKYPRKAIKISKFPL